jgi:hypothetical protein
MISLTISLGDVEFLLVFRYLRNLLSAILITARVAKEEVVGALLSILELVLLPTAAGSVVTGGFWSASPAMEREEWEQRKEQWMWSSKRLKGERVEVMGLDALNDG